LHTAAAQSGVVTIRPGVALPLGSTVLNPGGRQQIIDPASGQHQPGRFHTNIKVLVPKSGYPQAMPNISGPPQSGYLIETPASLGCVYHLTAFGSGCNPNVVTANPTGGSNAIAVVDAYDDTTAAADLATFDSQFGVTAGTFTKIYGTGNPANGCVNGTQPSSATGTGWDLEEALDVQYAHAMAPGAHIYLVEAASNSTANLLNAEQVAIACVKAGGGGQVSNSWGADEDSGETSNDGVFNAQNVVVLASSGDYSGTSWPCVSPNVMCVGGTTISRDQTTGAFQSETTWYNSDWYAYEDVGPLGTGGGLSIYEPRPSYQSVISSIVGNHRGVPDIAAVADPASGVWVYSTTYCSGWCSVGGTSLASPLFAGILNKAGYFWASSAVGLTTIYNQLQSGALASHVTNVNSGLCGPPGSSTYPNASGGGLDPQNIEATSGIHWNYCTGVGVPKDFGNPNAGVVRPGLAQ
jgi:subtilase family serine protease